MDFCSPKICIEVKTPTCPRCKLFEPTYQELQRKYPQYEYKVAVFGIDKEAQELSTKYGIKSAPTFVVMSDEVVEVVKQEDLEQTLSKYVG